MDKEQDFIATVLIPVHNSEKTLEEALDSCLAQITKFRYLILIVDDNSSDKSIGVALEYEKNYSNIRLVHSPYSGVGAALSFGINQIKTKYVIRMDADDIMLSQRIEEQVQFMEDNLEIVMCGAQIELFGNPVSKVANVYPLRDQEIQIKLLKGNAFADPTIIARRDSFQRIQLCDVDLDGAEQYALWLALSRLGPVANLPSVLLKYRVHSDQFTQKRRNQVILSTIRVQLRFACNKLYVSDSSIDKLDSKEKFTVLNNALANLIHSIVYSVRNRHVV